MVEHFPQMLTSERKKSQAMWDGLSASQNKLTNKQTTQANKQNVDVLHFLSFL